ncbi:MAG: hypothetical protein WBL68_15495 [Nitrososphaeraceae archaeon]
MSYAYTKQIVWRDATTGKILVQSDFFPVVMILQQKLSVNPQENLEE